MLRDVIADKARRHREGGHTVGYLGEVERLDPVAELVLPDRLSDLLLQFTPLFLRHMSRSAALYMGHREGARRRLKSAIGQGTQRTPMMPTTGRHQDKCLCTLHVDGRTRMLPVPKPRESLRQNANRQDQRAKNSPR